MTIRDVIILVVGAIGGLILLITADFIRWTIHQ